MKTDSIILKADKVHKNFRVGIQDIEVLKGNDVSIKKGDFVIVFGPSGCGKSTLLHTLMGLEKPTSGKVFLEGKDIYAMADDDINRYRKERIGTIFQQPIWIKSLNVIENVALPCRLLGIDQEKAIKMAAERLKIMGMTDWAYHHPSELSSGQQQKVSVARSLMVDPVLIIADEPTGNLDTVSGDELMELLLNLNQSQEKTILMVTHDLEYLRYATRIVHMLDGTVVEELDNKEGIEEMIKNIRTKKGERRDKTLRDKDFLAKNGNHYINNHNHHENKGNSKQN